MDLELNAVNDRLLREIETIACCKKLHLERNTVAKGKSRDRNKIEIANPLTGQRDTRYLNGERERFMQKNWRIRQSSWDLLQSFLYRIRGSPITRDEPPQIEICFSYNL